MTTRRATGPDGQTWRVRRRWIPHSHGRGIEARLRRKDAKKGKHGDGWFDGLELAGCADDLPGVAVVVLAIVALVIIVFVAPGVLLLGVDLAWFIIVFVGGVIARFVLGRPWRVEAEAGDGWRRNEGVRGFRAAGRRRDELVTELELGVVRRPGPQSPPSGRDTGSHG